MGNALYGNRFVEKLQSSGYKSPTYAMAEIIDNSVDAESDNIDIIIVEQPGTAGRSSGFISDVLFIDDGKGMTIKEINGCLRFSEGAGTADSRIGTFGVGLTNSSIFIGRRVEVYSKDKETDKWNYVFLDLDDQIGRDKPEYDDAVNKKPELKKLISDYDLGNASTIVRWTKIKNIGARQPATVIRKTSKLIGRIYRHVLDNVNIRFGAIKAGNQRFDIPLERILPFDPLFISETKMHTITELVWECATLKTRSGQNIERTKSVGNYQYYSQSEKVNSNKEFNTQFHYKKYIDGCKPYENTLPLFQKLDGYFPLRRTVLLNGKNYEYTIKAAFATKNIAHPGIRSGGGTVIGREFRDKMLGTKDFNGGNISFVRANREVDAGHYGMYTISNEKDRFWSIEISFNSDLDQLMGLDYQKQNVSFKYVDNDDVSDLHGLSNLGINEMQQLLFRDITKDIEDCRNKMQKILAEYARQFQKEEAAKSDIGEKEKIAIPEAEPAIFRVLPQGIKWTEEQKVELVRHLKKDNLSIEESLIAKQVEKFAEGLHNTIVLYTDSDESGNLFSLDSIRGIEITHINTNHIFYKNIIQPMKDLPALRPFTTALELIMCSYAHVLHDAFRKDPNFETQRTQELRRYLRNVSDALEEFISKSQIMVDVEHWRKTLENLEE